MVRIPRHLALFTVPNFLSAAECREEISFAESRGFGDAPISTGSGMVMRPDIRNNTRVMLDDVARAARLWERASKHAPAQVGTSVAVGLNERLRYYRYDPGQQFRRHVDGCFRRESGERSVYTFMVYLNDGFTGGATSFEDDGEEVTPVAGTALFFRHELVHAGCPVSQGRKYVLRSDVMYAEPA